MKKRLSLAKSPLPKIQSDQEAAEYFESHSVAGVWDQVGRGPSGQAVARVGQEDPRPARPCKVSDSTALGPRTDRRGETHRGCEVRRLPDSTPDVDRRGDPTRSEACLASGPSQSTVWRLPVRVPLATFAIAAFLPLIVLREVGASVNTSRPVRSYRPKATRNADAQKSETGLLVQVILLPVPASLNGVLLI